MFRPELYAAEPRESPKRLCWVLFITLAIPSNRFGFPAGTGLTMAPEATPAKRRLNRATEKQD